MKLMVYNIAYGTGVPGTMLGHIGMGFRYLRTRRRHLQRLIDFIRSENPDILGLLEVDTGSYRTGALNQVEEMALQLDHYHRSSVKYAGDSLGRQVPILRNQANAVLTKEAVSQGAFHFFPVGFKRLVIEVEYSGVSLFLVHLSLRRTTRSRQLRFLADLVAGRERVLVAGDFNLFSGSEEIRGFRDALRLLNANHAGTPTFPSWNPRRELDFILHSADIVVESFSVPNIQLSDHLPLVMEFH